MSDTEGGSDYEVIPEDKVITRENSSSQFQGFNEGMNESRSESATSTVSNVEARLKSSDDFLHSSMLDSMSQFLPNVLNSSSIHESSIDYTPLNKVNDFQNKPEGQIEDYSNESDDSLIAVHGEIKKTLLDAIDQMEKMKMWEEEKAELLRRVATLEGTVDRLSQKNKNLQKVNQNGTMFERRRREKTFLKSEDNNKSLTETQENEEEKEEEQPEKNEDNFKYGKFLMLPILIIYFLIVGAAIYHYRMEADRTIQKLESQIQAEKWNSEQLLARVVVLEKKLKISFDEIQKLNKVLYSPYPKDLYAIPRENDDVKEIGCFIRFNSSLGGVCQQLTDELEKELYENSRLKEKISVFRGALNAGISVLLAVVVVGFMKGFI